MSFMSERVIRGQAGRESARGGEEGKKHQRKKGCLESRARRRTHEALSLEDRKESEDYMNEEWNL